MTTSCEKLVNEVRRIADVIGSRPVMGHWPGMMAQRDQEILMLAADAIAMLQRELKAVAQIGHDLMAAQLQDTSSGSPDGK